MSLKYIANEIFLDLELLDRVLRKAYLLRITDNQDVQFGCDYFHYIPDTKTLSYHLDKSKEWGSLSLDELEACLNEINKRAS